MTDGPDDSAQESFIAEDVRRLWEDPPPPRRGPRPSLSRADVVEAAYRVCDAEGIAAVSMARIGEALGVTAMALYRHVASKDELLALLADRIAADLEDIPDGLDWRAGLELWTRRQVDLALAHPWFVDLPLSAVKVGPKRVHWLDQGFKVMRDLPLGAGEKLMVLGLLAQHVLGQARVEIDSTRAAAEEVRRSAGLAPDTPVDELDPAALRAANPFADFEVVLAHYADAATVPALFQAFVADGEEGGDAVDPLFVEPDEVGFGIRVMLDGLAAYVARRQASGGA